MIDDSAFVARCGLHDHAFYSIFHGEPFLTNDILWFFDGQNLRIVGYDALLRPISRRALLAAMEDARRRFRVRAIRLESPRVISIQRDYGHLTREIISRPKPYDFEVFVSRKTYRETGRIRADVRKATNAGLRCEVTDNQCRSLQLPHWRLLKAHIRSFDRAPFFEAELLSAIVFLFADPATVILEVFQDSELKGFGLARRSGPCANFHFLARAPACNGVSDIMYRALIRHYLDAGVETISLGGCPSKGLLDYKSKWAADFMLPGTYEIGWTDGAERRLEPNHLWMSQFLKGRLRA